MGGIIRGGGGEGEGRGREGVAAACLLESEGQKDPSSSGVPEFWLKSVRVRVEG